MNNGKKEQSGNKSGVVTVKKKNPQSITVYTRKLKEASLDKIKPHWALRKGEGGEEGWGGGKGVGKRLPTV